MVLHKNHNSPEFFSKGAELANGEVLLPARVDMLGSFTCCPQDAFEKQQLYYIQLMMLFKWRKVEG